MRLQPHTRASAGKFKFAAGTGTMSDMNTNKGWLRAPLAAAMLIMALASVSAQDVASVEQRVEALRQQLRDVTDRQAQLQARVQELDEALKPENIEKSVAGIGTTDASALRDSRRQQLEREKATVEEQLRSLETSRTRLEAAIATAEAEAVRLRASALNANNAPTTENGSAASSAASNNARASSSSNARQGGRRNVKRSRRARAKRRAPSR